MKFHNVKFSSSAMTKEHWKMFVHKDRRNMNVGDFDGEVTSDEIFCE